MTIVLQFQFWGLDVGEEAFGVTLSFDEVPERLTIPFAAITAFADPSVQFGLQFDSGRGKVETAKGAPARPTRARIMDAEATATRKRTAKAPKRQQSRDGSERTGPSQRHTGTASPRSMGPRWYASRRR